MEMTNMNSSQVEDSAEHLENTSKDGLQSIVENNTRVDADDTKASMLVSKLLAFLMFVIQRCDRCVGCSF
jgi:hypothetical protein